MGEETNFAEKFSKIARSMWKNDDSLRLLNWRQKRIARSSASKQCVIAGAGTGKTRILVECLKRILKKSQSELEKVLVITFSGKAANEIKNRLPKPSGTSEFKWITTIHSFCRELLKKEAIQEVDQNKFAFLLNSVHNELIAYLINENKLNSFKIPANQFEELICWQRLKKLSLTSAFDYVFGEVSSNAKKNEIADWINDLYLDHVNFLTLKQLYDYEDLLVKTYELLKENSKILEKWQKQFDFIFIDEFQDLDRIQYEIIHLLTQNKSRIFFIGDPDQSIYSWRGAIKNIVHEITEDFKGIKCSILKQNYRSTKRIVAVANRLISFNQERQKKKLYTENKRGKRVIYHHSVNQINEAKWVVNKIKQLVASRAHYQLGDFAIICRNNSWSKLIEQELVLHGLDYQLGQNRTFFDEIEIKNMVDWLRTICFKDNDQVLDRTCQSLLKIDGKDLILIKRFANDYETTLFNALSMHMNILNLSDSTHRIIDWFLIGLKKIEWAVRFNFGKIVKIAHETLKEKIGNLSYAQEENLNLFSQVVDDFEKTHQHSNLTSFLQQINHYYASAKKRMTKFEKANRVRIMTIHKSKGLEFPCVFVVGLINGVFPENAADLSTLEEERRNFYVAITRAEKRLFLSSCEWKNYANVPMKPSKFIGEIKSLCKIEK